MRHSAHLITTGPVGIPATSALAYDLTRGALIQGARLSGVRRYGRAPGSETDDTRPLGLAYTLGGLVEANSKDAYSTLSGEAAHLVDIGSNAGVSHLDTTPNTTSVYQTTSSVIGANAPFGIEWFIYEKAKDQTTALDRLSWDGWLFQIRNGQPELAEKSTGWNQAESDELVALWGLEEPTGEETARIAEIIRTIYASFESLSFENSTGRDGWVGQLFTLSFIPEPRGYVHLVLEGGGDATSYACERILKTKKAGQLWGASKLRISTTGGASFWQFKRPQFVPTGTIEYGPFPQSGPDDPFVDMTTRISADESGGTVEIIPTRPLANTGGQDMGFFGFRATLTAGSGTPWFYGATNRTPQGTMARSDDETFNSAELYEPVSGPREEGNPILDIDIVTEQNGERHGSIIIRDVNGLTFGNVGNAGNPGVAGIMNRRASCTLESRNKNGVAIASGDLFREALIVGGNPTDMKRFAYSPPGGGAAQQGSLVTAKGESRVKVDWFDGWQLLREKKCKPPLINDLIRYGYAVDAVLRVSGQFLTSGHTLGPIIDGPALGEARLSTNDRNATCADVLKGLHERYGLGLKLIQDKSGLWRLVQLSSTVVANFVSTAAMSDPDLLRGGSRYILNNPLDWYFDYSNYYNSFTLIWGEQGKERVYTSRIEESIHQPTYLNYMGRVKEYDEVVAPDIRTPGAAEYAMRSLKWTYGRFTKFAESNTFYHRNLAPYDRITADTKAAEVVSINGASIASDAMRFMFAQLP